MTLGLKENWPLTLFGVQPQKQSVLPTMREIVEDMSNVRLSEDCSGNNPVSLLSTDF